SIKAYDRLAEFEEHIKPLWDALHQVCEQRGFPIVMRVCHTQNADGSNSTANAHHFPSADEVPAELLLLPTIGTVGPDAIERFLALLDSDRIRCLAARDAMESTKH